MDTNGRFSDAEIKKILANVKDGTVFHRGNPGFFDALINTGNGMTHVCGFGKGRWGINSGRKGREKEEIHAKRI